MERVTRVEEEKADPESLLVFRAVPHRCNTNCYMVDNTWLGEKFQEE